MLDFTNKVILQINQNGEIVAKYKTIGEAMKLSGVNRHNISEALKGNQKTAGGFGWVLKEK